MIAGDVLVCFESSDLSGVYTVMFLFCVFFKAHYTIAVCKDNALSQTPISIITIIHYILLTFTGL